jgi:malonyl-CoA/methylmalonyl-CoA synthetase
MQSLYGTFQPAWRPGGTFLRTADGRCWTYADLDTQTARLSLRLQGAGLVPGNRLAAVVERSEWNVFLYLACLRAGIVYVPLNPRLTPPELGPVLADAAPGLVVCDPALEPTVRRLAGAAPVHTLDRAGGGTLAALPAARGAPDATLPPGHPAAIIFTSGTSGRPKGVLMQHALLAGKARALAGAMDYSAADRLLHTLPLYHAHGLFMMLHCVLSIGASLLLLPRFDAADVLRHLPQASVFSGVPTMYRRLLDEPGLRAAAAGVRLFISGSAPLPREVFDAFDRQAGHRIVECWGMSETMTNTANPLHGERRAGSAGKPLPGVELRVVDAAGELVAAGVPGVLEVGFATTDDAGSKLAGGSLFGSYWQRPAAEQPRVRDGRMVTGDIGVLDSDGYLRIVGRTSEVIISGGYNIYPREVEIALEELPGIARAAAFAVPHPDYGEAVVAAIEPVAGAAVQPAEVLASLRSRLVGYKLPKALFVEQALPLTELGKVQRAVLAKAHAHHFDRI